MEIVITKIETTKSSNGKIITFQKIIPKIGKN